MEVEGLVEIDGEVSFGLAAVEDLVLDVVVGMVAGACD